MLICGCVTSLDEKLWVTVSNPVSLERRRIAECCHAELAHDENSWAIPTGA